MRAIVPWFVLNVTVFFVITAPYFGRMFYQSIHPQY